MAGFIRRYGFFPPTGTITQIEGVVIVDLLPPGSIAGVDTGVVALVGEFADASYAVNVSSTDGTVSSNPQAVEVFSAADLLTKVGGWDETLGKFGAEMGNGFAALRNKKFSRLVVVPIDNVTPAAGSTKGVRVWRQLPTNQSATVALPIVPVSAAAVLAGREFKNGNNRVRLADRVVFTSDAAYASGTDGAWATAGAAATQPFTSATAAFITKGAKKGDVLVAGVIGAAGVQGSMADTYRIVSVDSATQVTVEKLDGTNFAATTAAAIAWRVHVGAAADSGPLNRLSEDAGFLVPARPLDATVNAGLALTPTVVPTAGTATSWDPLSGLTGKVSSTNLTYDANVHAPNAANNATLDARYQAALAALLSDAAPAADVNVVVAARKSSTIRNALKGHALTASERGLTRTVCVAPSVNQNTLATVLGDADPGVGANRNERVFYSWPAARTSVPEAVGFSVACADGTTTTDGILDDPFDGWLASLLSNLPPENNPGQAAPPVPTVLASVLGFGRGVPTLAMPDYIAMRAAGIAGLRLDRTAGPIIQSGVTTSLTSGEKNISRRRMADFMQDSIARRTVQLSKLPKTQQNKDAITGEIEAFLSGLLSVDNPVAQRIAGYEIDDVSGNTDALDAAGIFVVIWRVRLLGSLDFIVLQSEVGEGVVLTRTV